MLPLLVVYQQKQCMPSLAGGKGTAKAALPAGLPHHRARLLSHPGQGGMWHGGDTHHTPVTTAEGAVVGEGGRQGF